MKKQFDGCHEYGTRPGQLTGADVYDMVKDIKVTYGKGTKSRGPNQNPSGRRGQFSGTCHTGRIYKFVIA